MWIQLDGVILSEVRDKVGQTQNNLSNICTINKYSKGIKIGQSNKA